MHSPIKRWGWFALGWVMVALGVAGFVLPVMPGTIFMIFAAGCFSHSSPRFEAWLLNHRWFGTSIRRWRARGAIPRKAKIVAITSMAGGYGVLQVTARPVWWVDLLVAATLVACAVYVASRPDE